MGETLFALFSPKTALMYLWAQAIHDGFLVQASQMHETYENEAKPC